MSNIHSPNVVTNGIVACWDAGSRASYPGAGTTITATTDNEVGDWIELVSDGTYWYISGQSGHADGFTVAS